MTRMGTQLTTAQLRKAWVELSIEPTPYAQLKMELQRKRERLEELRNMPMIVDNRAGRN